MSEATSEEPASLSPDALMDSRRSKNLVILITSSLLTLFGVFFSSFAFHAGLIRYSLVIFVFTIIIGFSSFLFYRKPNSVPIRRLVIFICACLTLYVFYTGGTFGVGFIWTVMVPIFAFFVLGERDGLSFTILFLLIVAALFALHKFPPHWARLPYSDGAALSMLFIYIFVAIMTFSYESSQAKDKRLLSAQVAYSNQMTEKAIRASAARSEFIANVSHEMRTPLNSIVGFAEILLERNSDPETRRMLETVGHQSETLLKLIDDVLDESKMGAGRLELSPHPFDLVSILDDVHSMGLVRAAERGIALSVDCPDSVPRWLVGDGHRIKQVLVNLVGNAIKFTHQGSVTLRARSSGLDTGRVRLRLEVADTGIGIPKDKQEKIFEQFAQADGSTTRRYGGTGLGTTISRNLVRLMGGELRVESEPGQGSTFYFEIELPTSTEADVQALEYGEQHAKNPSPRTLRILVAEDYEPNQQVVRAHLESAGHSVHLAENGQTALEAFAREPFDIVLLDVQMPVMDGFDAARRIRELEAARHTAIPVPLVALTANMDSASRTRAIECGMNHILTKPIRRQKLLHILQRLAVQSSPAPESEPAATPPPAAESGPPLDLPRLLEDFNGQRSPVAKLLLKFSTHLVAICAEMREALNQKNMDALRRGAHKIKGASSNYAAHALARVASQLEEAASRGNSAICDPLLGQLDFEKQRLLDFLNSPAFTSPVPPSHS